ncbi:MAG: hypothetical protein LC635_04910 [Pseudonocardiaceae bacterium]|nr:hypothetical protein [Pseudonocardiaceae bacterium]
MRILVLGCTAATSWGRDQLARLAAQARRRGLTVVGADSPGRLRTARDRTHVDETIELDVRDPVACREWAAEATDIAAVLTVHERAVLGTAVVAAELGLPGIAPEVAAALGGAVVGELSAEGVVLGGVPKVLALVSKKTNARGVVTGHRAPAPLDDTAAARATEAIEQGVAAAGVTHGLFHVEFWLTAGGVVLGAVHARPGGHHIHALVEHSRPGLELYGQLLDDLLGRPAEPIPPVTRAAGAEFLLLPPGRLYAVAGWHDVVNHPRTLAADLLVAPGDELATRDRHGLIAAGADTSPAVEAALGDLRSRLVVDVARAA